MLSQAGKSGIASVAHSTAAKTVIPTARRPSSPISRGSAA